VAKQRANGGSEPAPRTAAATPPAPGGGVPQGSLLNDLNLVGAGPGPAAPRPADAPPPAEDAALGAADQQHKLLSQMVQTRVQNVVNDARKMMSQHPEQAIQNVELEIQRVKQTSELDIEVRDQLMGRLQMALRVARNRQGVLDVERQHQAERLAQAEEQRRITENLLQNQKKIKSLIDRFGSLLAEGRYREAEESGAAQAARLIPANDPTASTAVAATLSSRATGYLSDAMTLRVARQKGVVDTLYQVEKAHIPMPDEPPIVYPDAEWWREMTARRKEKYSSTELSQRKPAEKKIDEALKSPTQLEFAEMPLNEVVDYLKELHGIEIQLDKPAFDEAGVPIETPITRNLKGISLRSALRLMLRDLGLTYMIQDEVLLITSPDRAEQKMSIRVYPVADLVLPINNNIGGMGMMGMGGMGMGGMGMMGMGGMGMGMGGMGMGGMGMGGMGGWGGGMGGMGGMGGWGGGMGGFGRGGGMW
jgi:hypothetical protein